MCLPLSPQTAESETVERLGSLLQGVAPAAPSTVRSLPVPFQQAH